MLRLPSSAFSLVLGAVLLAGAAGCATEPEPEAARVRLVPADSLTALLPDSVGTYGATEDETLRGYFAGRTGALGVITVFRTFQSGPALATLSASSADDAGRFRAVVTNGGGRLMAAADVAADSTLAAAEAAGWSVFTVSKGLLLLDAAGHAVEAKSTFPGIAPDALRRIDLARFAAMPAEEVVVDSTFVREAPQASGPDEAP